MAVTSLLSLAEAPRRRLGKVIKNEALLVTGCISDN
jgi:hypothetical protein